MKRSRIIVASIILLVVLGASAWWFMAQRQRTPTTDVPNVSGTPATLELTSREKANQLAAEGKYDEGQKLLDTEILAKATDDDQKVGAYIEKAVFALNGDQFDQAMSYAKQADAIASSRSTLRLMAQISARKGDKAAAKQYYQQALASYTAADLEDPGIAMSYYDDSEAMKGLGI